MTIGMCQVAVNISINGETGKCGSDIVPPFIPPVLNPNAWTPLTQGLNSGSVTANFERAISFGDTGIVVGQGGNNAITTDAGVTWTALSKGTIDVDDCYSIHRNPITDVIMIGGFGRIYRSTDDGVSFFQIAETVFADNILALKHLSGNVWIGCGLNGMAGVTQDDGLTWTTIVPDGGGVLESPPYRSIGINSNGDVVIGGNNNISVSNISDIASWGTGATWSIYDINTENPGYDFSAVVDIETDGTRFILLGNGFTGVKIRVIYSDDPLVSWARVPPEQLPAVFGIPKRMEAINNQLWIGSASSQLVYSSTLDVENDSIVDAGPQALNGGGGISDDVKSIMVFNGNTVAVAMEAGWSAINNTLS